MQKRLFVLFPLIVFTRSLCKKLIKMQKANYYQPLQTDNVFLETVRLQQGTNTTIPNALKQKYSTWSFGLSSYARFPQTTYPVTVSIINAQSQTCGFSSQKLFFIHQASPSYTMPFALISIWMRLSKTMEDKIVLCQEKQTSRFLWILMDFFSH